MTNHNFVRKILDTVLQYRNVFIVRALSAMFKSCFVSSLRDWECLNFILNLERWKESNIRVLFENYFTKKSVIGHICSRLIGFLRWLSKGLRVWAIYLCLLLMWLSYKLNVNWNLYSIFHISNRTKIVSIFPYFVFSVEIWK